MLKHIKFQKIEMAYMCLIRILTRHDFMIKISKLHNPSVKI